MNIIICGAGGVGTVVADYLYKAGHHITVIDKNEEAIVRIRESVPAYCVVGDALSFDLLLQSGIESASVILAVTGNDAVNIALCQIAYSFFGIRIKVARIKRNVFFYNNIMPYSFAPDFIFLFEMSIAESLYARFVYNTNTKEIRMANNNIELFAYPAKNNIHSTTTEINNKIEKDGGKVFAIMNKDNNVLAGEELANYTMEDGDVIIAIGKNLSFLRYSLSQKASEKNRGNLLLFGDIEVIFILLKLLYNDKNFLKNKIVVVTKKKSEAQRIASSFEDIDVMVGNIFHDKILNNINMYNVNTAIIATNNSVLNVVVSNFLKKHLYSKPQTIISNDIFEDSFLKEILIDFSVNTKFIIKSFFSKIMERIFFSGLYKDIFPSINFAEINISTDSIFAFKSVEFLIEQRKIKKPLAVYRDDDLFFLEKDFILEPGDFVIGILSV